MNTREKGRKAEKRVCDILGTAGYATFNPENSAYGENDVWGLFDVMAIAPHRPPRAVQVKCNGASGVRGWMRHARLWRAHGFLTEYWVKHDREGWRVLQPADGSYRTVYDERKDSDVSGNRHTPLSLGEGVERWLQQQDES